MRSISPTTDLSRASATHRSLIKEKSGMGNAASDAALSIQIHKPHMMAT